MKAPEVVRDSREMRADPVLSVIVPCFNAAETVLETLEGLWKVRQNHDLECLVIDDGSSDATLLTLKVWLDAGEKSGFLLITQPNQGLSAVRNLGVKLARGQWLAFLDSDDRITSDGFSALWSTALSTPAEVILGGSLIFDGQGSSDASRPFYHADLWQGFFAGGSERLTSVAAAPALLGLEPNCNYRWIRRSFYLESGLHFPEGRWFEDIPVHFRMLIRASAVALVDTPYYLYRVNRPGKITESEDLRRFDALKTIELARLELKAAALTSAQGGAALRTMIRLAWGCGRMTPASARLDFFKGLGLSGVPLSWRWRSLFFLPARHWPLAILMTLGWAWPLVLASRIQWRKSPKPPILPGRTP